MKWENLFEVEKEQFRKRAQTYLEQGFYQGFDVEELAVMLYRKENG